MRFSRQSSPPPRLGSDRASSGGFEIIVGKHAVRAVFLARPQAVRRVVLLQGAVRYLDEFFHLAEGAGLQPEVVPRRTFLQIGNLADEKHQGVLVFADPPPVYGQADLAILETCATVVALDQVSNPENFGTVIRNAAFFGADAVIWMKNRAVDLSPTVIRVSVGGVELIKLFRVTNLASALEALKALGFWVYGLDERGEQTLAETDFAGKSVLVIGAEGEGLRRRTKEECDVLVRIPGGRPGLESLNAGVASAVALAEVFRQPREVSGTKRS